MTRIREEYLSSNGSGNFNYGPAGDLFPKILTKYVVRSMIPIQKTDNIFLEYSDDNGQTWNLSSNSLDTITNLTSNNIIVTLAPKPNFQYRWRVLKISILEYNYKNFNYTGLSNGNYYIKELNKKFKDLIELTDYVDKLVESSTYKALYD